MPSQRYPLLFQYMVIDIFDDMSQVTTQEVERLLPLVSDQRQEEALRYKHLQGQFACLKSYEMLHHILTREGIISSDTQLLFQRNKHGKPSLKGINGIYFNISHCRNAIAVAVDKQNIGIDIECFRTPTPALLQYTMNESEIAEVNQSAHPDRSFSLFWTQKEALFKYLGTGIHGDIPNLLSQITPEIVLSSKIETDKGYALTVAYTQQ